MAISDRLEIIRFCESPKNKRRIMSKLGLNEMQVESHLTILEKQSMLIQINGKYVVTMRGQHYVLSNDRMRKIKS